MKSPNRIAVIFVGASILAGPFNYFYQVAASMQLSGEDFARLNGWLANLAVLFFASSVLQFYANFRPVSGKTFFAITSAIHALSVIFLIVLWRTTAEPLSMVNGAGILFMVCAASWLSGQAQIRLHFMALSVAGLCLAVSRLGIAMIPSAAGQPTMEKFIFANFAAYFGMIWILTWAVYSKKEVSVPKDVHWMGAVVLSLAGTLIPQYDMFLMNHTQNTAGFVEFSRASIFGRGLFAIVFLSAQWLLPSQLRGGRRLQHGYLWRAMGGLVVACATVAWLAPFIVANFLKWDAVPGQTLIFLAGLEYGLLAMIFLLIQDRCSRAQLGRPAIGLTILVSEGIGQYCVQLPATEFLTFAVGIQLALVVFLSPRNS